MLYEMYRPVVSATVADVVGPDDRPRAYSLIYWAVNIGASLAPLIGSVIAARSYRALFAADAATTVLYGLIVWAALPETRPHDARSSSPRPPLWRTVRRDRLFLAVCALNFAFSLVFFQSFVALPLDVRAHGLSPGAFGVLIAINGILIVLVQPFAGEMIRRRSQPLTLACASLLLGIGFGLNAWAGSMAGYATSVAIWTLGEILYAPASTSLVADLAPADLRGAYQGGFALAFTAAFAAAPAIGGYAMAHIGGPALWAACLVTGLSVSAGFVVMSRAVRFNAAKR
jgi:predicted MFS family arabinose efflux permease